MKKRGQVTLFIIIAVVIIAIVLLLVFLRPTFFKRTNNIPEVTEINDHVHSCLKETTDKGITFLSMRGGYFTLPENNIIFNLTGAPYYYNQSILIPTKEKIEFELADFILFRIKDCINLSEKNYSIQTGEMNAAVTLKDSLKIILTYPINLELGDSSYYLNSFSYETKTPLNLLYESAILITEKAELNQSVPLSLSSSLANENNFSVDIQTWPEQTYLFLLTKQINQEQNLTFRFAIRI